MPDLQIVEVGLPAVVLLQITACLAAGIAASVLWRAQAARAHWTLVLGVVGALVMPIASLAVYELGWGRFVRSAPLTEAPEKAVAPRGPAVERALDLRKRDRAAQRAMAPAPPTQSDSGIGAPFASESAALDSKAAAPARSFPVLDILVAAWAAASSLLLLRLCVLFLAGRRLLARAEPVNDAAHARAHDTAIAALHLRLEPRLMQSNDVRSPVIWCWSRRPALLLPKKLPAAGDWSGVLCHELAHWRRWDHLWSLLSRVLSALLPWHPLAWWAQRRLLTLSEQACDDWAVAAGQSAADYAQSLLALVPQKSPRWSLAALSNRKTLAVRLNRILADQRRSPVVGRRWSLVAIGTAHVLVAAISLAQVREQTAIAAPRGRTVGATDAAPTPQPQPAVGRSKALATPNAQEQLSIRIDLGDATDPAVIDVDKPFRVVFTNTADHAIRVWHPRTRNGYDQISFRFTNARTGERHYAHRTPIGDDEFWQIIEPDLETVEIAPNDYYATRVLFNDFNWGQHTWIGLPCPNSGDRFAISAQFDSSVASPNADEPIWIGKVESDEVTAAFVAPRIKTPHDYLSYGYPGRAIEIMRADPKWIGREQDWSTPLHFAAWGGHEEAVEWLLGNEADVNAVGGNGFTALHGASDPDVIALILKKKPDLTIRTDSQGRTPLQEAAAKLVDARSAQEKQRWQEIIKLYLDAGADYDVLTAICLADLKRIETVLSEAPKLADDFQDGSLLREAASLGRLEICRYLVEEHHVDVDDFERGNGYPIIKGALAYPDIVRLLIENGADLQKRITWQGGRTGVWIIGDDATALHFAARDGVPETINLLINHGVDIFAMAHDLLDETKKQTALEVAAFFGKGDNARAILNHPKFAQADPQVRRRLLDKCLVIGASPTFLARDADRPNLVEALLEKGADPNASENGVTAVQIAARQMFPTSEEENREIKGVVAVLVKHGAALDLYSAVAIGDETQVARLLEQDPESAAARGPDGYPALHLAVGMNDPSIVRILLDAGVDVEIRSQRTGSLDETALHVAASWGRDEIAAILIHARADVNALAPKGATPLHIAAIRTNVRTARLLLENGARIDARDEEGATPLDWCRRLNWTNPDDIEKLFREYRRKQAM